MAFDLPRAVQTAVDFAGSADLGYELLKVAEVELGPTASYQEVEDRASRLALEAILAVGLAPQTQEAQRQRLFALLRGDALPERELIAAVEFLLGEMLDKSKGALAERLAIKSCLDLRERLVREGRLPEDAEVVRSAREPLARVDGGGQISFYGMAQGADGVFCLPATPARWRACVSDSPLPASCPTDALLIFGVAEVKAGMVARPKLRKQVNSHLIRLCGGLELKRADGSTVVYPPEQLWFTVLKGSAMEVVSVALRPVEMKPQGVKRRSSFSLWKRWTHPAMDRMLALTIGPRLPERPSHLRALKPWFDAALPFSEAELEAMGAAMVAYTLGVMADQPCVDLGWKEWAPNVERLLQSVPTSRLTKEQIRRRQRLLSALF